MPSSISSRLPLTVGAHPQNLSLSVLSRRPEAVAALREQGIGFFVHSAGAQTIPLVRLGVLQLAGTGATPPLLAQAAGLPSAIFAMGEPRPERGGILVRADSPFHTLADLRGRGLALMPISWHTQFVAAELDAAGLDWRDVNAVELLPATAAEAFVAGLLDAIVATDPLHAQIAARVPLRILAAPGEHFSNRTAFWAPLAVLDQHPQAVQALVDAIAMSDRAIADDPETAAQLLDGLGGSSAAQWLQALRARPWGIRAPDAAFAEEQQRHADLFARFGLIPARIDASATVSTAFPPATP
jgi:sulfonate transport system substrate-binding protein